jgi:hypothetical protein
LAGPCPWSAVVSVKLSFPARNATWHGGPACFTALVDLIQRSVPLPPTRPFPALLECAGRLAMRGEREILPLRGFGLVVYSAASAW